MQIKDVMTKKVITISEEANIKDAITSFKKHDIGFLIVTNDFNEVQGVITDRDLLLYLDDKAKFDSKIADIMKKNIISVNQNMDISVAAELFGYYQIKRLVVLNDYDDLIGVISVRDLAIKNECLDYALDALTEISYSNNFPMYVIDFNKDSGKEIKL